MKINFKDTDTLRIIAETDEEEIALANFFDAFEWGIRDKKISVSVIREKKEK